MYEKIKNNYLDYKKNIYETKIRSYFLTSFIKMLNFLKYIKHICFEYA